MGTLVVPLISVVSVGYSSDFTLSCIKCLTFPHLFSAASHCFLKPSHLLWTLGSVFCFSFFFKFRNACCCQMEGNFPCNYPVQTFTFCDAEDSCNLTWIKQCILLVYKGHQKKHVMQFLTNKKKQLRRLYYKSVHCIVWGLNPEKHRRELPGSPSRGWVTAVPRTTACWRWHAVFVLLKGSGWFFDSVIDAVLKTASE